MRTLALNPVLARELKERVRGRRSVVILTLYLAGLTGVLWLVYQASNGSSHNEFGQPMPTQLAEIGYRIFDWVLFVMALVVLFLVPAQSAGAIAGERERQTLVPLQLTLLTPRSILLGKIGSSMAFLGLLLVAAIPVMSIAYLVGGITIPEVLSGTALLLAVGLCIATMCASISTFAKRVQTATVLSYGLVLVLLLGTGAVYGGAAVVDQSRGVDAADPPSALLLLNPLATVGDLVGRGGGSVSSSPLNGMKELVHRDDINDDFFGGGPDFRAVNVLVVDDQGQVQDDADDRILGVPFWGWSLFFLAGVALLSLLLAARRLRAPSSAER